MKLSGQRFRVIRQAGDTGQLYGSVSTRDVSDAVTAGGFTIDRVQVLLDRPIKNLGCTASHRLHPRSRSGSRSTSRAPRKRLIARPRART